MLCKKCSTENPEDALFCKKCGSKLNRPCYCAKCGTQIVEGAAFCVNCGTPVLPPPENLAIPAEELPERPQPAETAPSSFVGTLKKISSYICEALSIVVAATALIFVFTIGIKLSTNLNEINAYTLNSDVSIYDFFGKLYKDFKRALSTLTEYSSYYATTNNVYFAFGTVVAAVSIIAVVATSIISIIRSVLKLIGKGKRSGIKFAAAAYASFALGAALLLNIKNVSIENVLAYGSGYATQVYNVKFKLNSAPVAGIIIGAVALVCAVAAGALSKGGEYIKGPSLAKRVCSLAMLIFCIISISLALMPAVKIDGNLYKEEFGNQVDFRISLICAINIISSSAITPVAYSRLPKSYLNDATILIFCNYAMLIIMAIVAVYIVSKACSVLSGEEERNVNIGTTVLMPLAAIISLVFTIVSANYVKKIMFFDYDFSDFAEYGGKKNIMYFGYSRPIVALIMSIFSIASAITGTLVYKRLTRK